MSLGLRLAGLRKGKGMTQARLATLAALSPSAIAMYETNRRQPDKSALDKLAFALGVSVDFLEAEADLQQSEANRFQGSDAKLQSRSKQQTTPSDAVGTQVTTTFATDVVSTTGLSTLALTREESRFILFMRMNPQHVPFLTSYVLADSRKREQLEKAWRLIHDFQL